MVKFLAHSATATGVGVLGVAIACFALGGGAWAADLRGLAIAAFVAGSALLIFDVAVGAVALREWASRRRKGHDEAKEESASAGLCDRVAVAGAIRWDRGQPGGRLRGKYLVVSIENTSQRDLVNARLRLERIEQWLPQSNTWYAPEWFSPLFLVVSFNDGGGDKTTIGSGERRTWDLVCYESESDTHAKILAAQPELRTSNQVRFGKWRVLCRLAADNCGTCDLTATFEWNHTDVIPGRTLNFEGPVTYARKADE